MRSVSIFMDHFYTKKPYEFTFQYLVQARRKATRLPPAKL